MADNTLINEYAAALVRTPRPWGRHLVILRCGVLAALLALGCESQTQLANDAGVDATRDVGEPPPGPDRGEPPLDVGRDTTSAGDAGADLGEAGPDLGDAGADVSITCSHSLIPAPCQPGYDAPLEALATQYERSFHLISAAATGVFSDLMINDPAHRTLVETFLRQSQSWDFEAQTGKPVTEVVSGWFAAAGLYSGVGIAADAYRYGVLRDQGYPGAEVQRARQHLIAALESLHLAATITGMPGAIARGYLRTDMPAWIPPTTPLFDANGDALPAEKDNGTWREDNSGGLYPNYVWVDSCSRDQLLGWVAAYGAAWEVIKDDAAIPASSKSNLQQGATDLGLALKTVRPSGFDLELVDPDGRTTYHGYMHESAFDRTYLPNPYIKNAINAVIALGIIATLAYVSEDQALEDYLQNQLIGARELHKVIKGQLVVDLGPKSDYSGFNMAFMGAWLATRYLKPGQALSDVRHALQEKLYDNPQGLSQPQPSGWKQSLFDLIAAAGQAEASAHGPTTGAVDSLAVSNSLDTLSAFPQPPFWVPEVINCDAAELAAFSCIAIDGSTPIVLNPVTDDDEEPQSILPVPFHLRPPSNYDWRSNPHRVNDVARPGLMITGVDFRFPYWLGRWVKR